MDTHFFSVPLRLIWGRFRRIHGRKLKTYTASGSARLDETPDFTVAAPVAPTITAGGSGEAEGSLADYLGVPTKTSWPCILCSVAQSLYTHLETIGTEMKIYKKQATLDTTSGTDSTAYAILNRGKTP